MKGAGLLKRTAEFVLGIIAVLLGIGGIALGFYSLSALSSPETQSAMISITGSVDMESLIAETTRSTYITAVISGILALVSLVATLMIRKNKAPYICGILFLGSAAFGFFFGFGIYIGCIVLLIAGIMSIVRQEKKEELIYVSEAEDNV